MTYGPHSATIIPLHRPLPPGRLGDAVTQARANRTESEVRALMTKLRLEYLAAQNGGIK